MCLHFKQNALFQRLSHCPTAVDHAVDHRNSSVTESIFHPIINFTGGVYA